MTVLLVHSFSVCHTCLLLTYTPCFEITPIYRGILPVSFCFLGLFITSISHIMLGYYLSGLFLCVYSPFICFHCRLVLLIPVSLLLFICTQFSLVCWFVLGSVALGTSAFSFSLLSAFPSVDLCLIASSCSGASLFLHLPGLVEYNILWGLLHLHPWFFHFMSFLVG
jgi:hypothetical protein